MDAHSVDWGCSAYLYSLRTWLHVSFGSGETRTRDELTKSLELLAAWPPWLPSMLQSHGTGPGDYAQGGRGRC